MAGRIGVVAVETQMECLDWGGWGRDVVGRGNDFSMMDGD